MVDKQMISQNEVEEIIENLKVEFLKSNQTVVGLALVAIKNMEISDVFLKNVKIDGHPVFRVRAVEKQNLVLDGYEALEYLAKFNPGMLISDVVNETDVKLISTLPDSNELAKYYVEVAVPIKKIEESVDMLKKYILRDDANVGTLYRLSNLFDVELVDLFLKNIKQDEKTLFKNKITPNPDSYIEGYDLIRFHSIINPNLMITDLIGKSKEQLENMLPDSRKLAAFYMYTMMNNIIDQKNHQEKDNEISMKSK